MNFVTVKSVEHQKIQVVHRVGELLVQQRTALTNRARGLFAERGVSIARTRQAFKREVPEDRGRVRGRSDERVPGHGAGDLAADSRAGGTHQARRPAFNAGCAVGPKPLIY